MRQSEPAVSILIAVSSPESLLDECLASLARYMPADVPSETIVVLNALPDAKAAQLEARHPAARFIRSPVNLGMAGSANRARAEAAAPFLAVLHDDAVIEPDWIEGLLRAAERHPKAGAIGSKVLNPDGSLQSAGMIVWRGFETSPPWPDGAPPADRVREAQPVDYCGTCSLLVRADTFDVVGGFNEDIYPAYGVDVDFGFALRSIGSYVLCEPGSVVRHRRGASSTSELRRIMWSRNHALLAARWASAAGEHEPSPDGSRSDACRRSLERARRHAEACERGDAAPVRPDAGTVQPFTFDAARQEAEHWRRYAELQAAHVRELERRIEAFRNSGRTSYDDRTIVQLEERLARYQRMKVVRIYSAILAWREATRAGWRRFRQLAVRYRSRR